MLFDSTVAAIATANGRGAIAVLRLSGPEAREILARVCPSLDETRPRAQQLAAVRHPTSGELIDRALVTVFPAPQSYTGEDVIEVSVHGGALTPQLVLDALYAAGAAPAEPGEFTRRAVLNGKLDLLQAEAILDLVDGRSRALHRAAIHQVERGLSSRIEELRAAILRVEALVAYSIDFPDEDEPPVPQHRVNAAAHRVVGQIDRLLETAPQGELLREGALVVLAGRPNSGKSSLFNALLGVERAIVTQIPGTTRDALEGPASIEGYPFTLVDTAGMRESVDPIERIGIEVARRYLAAANIVLFCAEHGRALERDELDFIGSLDPARALLVRTKADASNAPRDRPDQELSLPCVVLSAFDGAGIPDLRRELLRLAFGAILGDPGEAPLVTRERHARALREARAEVLLFLDAAPSGIPPELAATHLRAAAGTLADLVGAITPDDVLGEVFGQFCIGK